MPTPTYMTAERPRTIVQTAGARRMRRSDRISPTAARVASAPATRVSVSRLIEYVLVAITASAGSWFVFELVRYLTAR